MLYGVRIFDKIIDPIQKWKGNGTFVYLRY